MEIAEQILSQPQLLSFLTLIIAWGVEKYLPWPDKFHPLSLWKLVVLRMGDKVLPSNQDGPKQHQISGALACIVLLIPVCIIISIFVYLAEYPLFFETLFLVIALRHRNIDLVASKMPKYLKGNKKQLAKDSLAPILLRETDKLSPLGLCKATCETLVLRFNYQFCAVIFWFMLTGGIGALLYRVLYECTQNWPIKDYKFRYFGRFTRYLVTALQWPSSLLAGLSVALASVTLAGLNALVAKYWLKPRSFLLNIAGASLGCQFGGPALYKGVKHRTVKCGAEREVVLADLKRCINLLNLTRMLWFCVCFVIYAGLYTIYIH